MNRWLYLLDCHDNVDQRSRVLLLVIGQIGHVARYTLAGDKVNSKELLGSLLSCITLVLLFTPLTPVTTEQLATFYQVSTSN